MGQTSVTIQTGATVSALTNNITFTNNGSATLTNAGSLAIGGAGSTITPTGSNTLTLAGQILTIAPGATIIGTGSLTFLGSGTVSIPGAITNNSMIGVGAAGVTLNLGNRNSLGANGSLLLAGGTVNTNATITVGGGLILQGGTSTLNLAKPLTFNGAGLATGTNILVLNNTLMLLSPA